MASSDPALTKSERLRLFIARLEQAEAAANHDEAMNLLANTLNAVEDEHSGVAYDPKEPGTDGRMYPPNERFRYLRWGRQGVRCYRQVSHATFVADNGAIEIRQRSGGDLGGVSCEKPGTDGKMVRDYDSSE